MRKIDKDKPQFPINYKGKTYNTTICHKLTDEEFKQCRREYYKKPDFNLVKDQLLKVSTGGKKINYITNYYFKDIMAKTRASTAQWTIEDAFKYKPLLEFFAGKVYASPNFYNTVDVPLSKNIEVAFSLCGASTCTKAPQFPIQAVDNILDKYNINNNYYDFACGWGARLLSALRNNVNYFGTDPNHLLYKRLIKMSDDYKNIVKDNSSEIDIRTTGSEVYIQEWENKIGVAFTSPPYYDVEDYRIGKQSYVEGITTYESWLNDYVKPTIDNIYKYLVPHGYLCVNIKNVRKYKLVEDWDNIIRNKGFEFVCTEELKNRHRCHGHIEWNNDDLREDKCGMINNDEKIYVYRKK